MALTDEPMTKGQPVAQGLMAGRRGLVMGVANERSIAFGIARAMADQGAEIGITYQGEAFGRRAKPLAEALGGSMALDVDVTDEGSMERAFGEVAEAWGGLDFVVHAIAFCDKAELAAGFRFSDTSRANFLRAMEISCYSLIDVARRAAPLMTEGGSITTLTFQGSRRVTPCYNIMGVAKAGLETAVSYLADDLGPQGIRVNAISPGPMKTLAGSAIGGARRTYKYAEANAPLRANAGLEAIGGTAVWLASDWGACTTGEVVTVDGGLHVLGMPQLENLSAH